MSRHSGIADDLNKKISKDVIDAMHRTLSVAPEHLTVAVAGAAAALGTLAAAIADKSEDYTPGDAPDEDTVLLAALLCVRCAFNEKDGISRAYRDLERLKEPTPHPRKQVGK